MAEGSEPPYFMNTCPIFFATPPIQILSTFLPPPSLLPPITTSTAYSVALFLWLNGWSCDIWCAFFLNDIMDVHMSSLKTLMHVLCSKTSSLLRSDMWFFAGTLIWHHALTNTHMQRHTAHSGASILTHPYKCYLHQFSCAHNSYLYCTEWRICIYQTFTSYIVFFSKIILLQKSHLLIRCYKTMKYFETQIILIEMVEMVKINKTDTHTHQTLRKITMERVS